MAIITYRDCRALRHAMERMDGPAEAPAPIPESPLWHAARYVICLRCMRCGTWRFIAIDRHGHKLATCYRWPDDYLRPKGEPRVSTESMYLWLAKPGADR